MATKTYMYLNNGTKVPVYGNANTHSMPYRTYVTEETPKTSQSTKKTGTGRQTVTTVTAPAVTGSGAVQAAYDSGSAALAEEMRKQRKAEEARAAEEARRRQEKINAIKADREKASRLLGTNMELEKSNAKLANSDNLRQLYIAYMQGLQGIPQKSAVWGAGGEIESLKNRSRLNYETNRAKENRSYSELLGDIQQRYNNDLIELEKKYLQQLLNV